HVIDGTWQPNDRDKANGLVSGFGVTIQIINGGVECGGADENAQSLNRIAYYKEFANYLKVPVPADEVLGCKKMKQFDEGGAGALPIYWEQDWGWSADTADGKTYSCQLVGYQTPYTAFKEGDYTKCVQHYFNVNVVDDNGTTEPDVTPTPAPVTDENVAPVARI
ncbi:glycoside hydrolase family 19 protein, partial [Escherichia coli]